MRAFWSELRKIARPGVLAGTGGTMIGLASLVTVVFFALAKDELSMADLVRGGILKSTLAGRGGLTVAFAQSGQLLGVVALVLFAQSFAQEYTLGTLKVLLSREPRRPRLLLGKLAALGVFSVAAVLVAALVASLVALAMAAGRGIPTAAWFTADGWQSNLLVMLRAATACLVWGLMGTVLAVLLRSAAPAIGIGVSFVLIGEPILALVLKDNARYLPGQALQAFATWGHIATAGGPDQPTPLSGPASLVALALYGLAFAAVSATLFVRRDVSS